MTKFYLILLLTGWHFGSAECNAQENYLNYHLKVVACEQLIVKGKNASAIEKPTGLNLYLPKGWQKGKIKIEEK
ncbi:hypothetical protein SAMN04488057_10665 [Cyclobacterium lianum]|uniref:Uncharacterized protein n=1 Tax=Cyclobacterium lianum TaxID=388280 RepID=A0A1M7NTQ8_9BACT|nr:hypothetical protein [Cyclobacterium lianum]SHN07415.1 hypothetical protein SAMN04488057_10665 [Cyclobacterium lianum]